MLKKEFHFYYFVRVYISWLESNWLMPFKLLILCDGIHSGFISINNRHQQANMLSGIELSFAKYSSVPLNERPLMVDTWVEPYAGGSCEVIASIILNKKNISSPEEFKRASSIDNIVN